MRKLLIATSNKNKQREILSIIGDIPYRYLSLNDVNYQKRIRETGTSYLENAVIKAKKIGSDLGLLTLSEDSGLEIDALAGKPGIYSARYCSGTDLDRINKILEQLKNTPKKKRTARFVSWVAVYDPLGKKIYTFKGVSYGLITERPIGDNGFGFDPIFFNQDLQKTNAQATLSEKNRVSHRAKALVKSRKILMNLL